MREERDTDFFISLRDVGTFRYGRKSYLDRLQIRARFLRLVKDLGEGDPDLNMYAGIIATHSVLCVEAPAGWEDIAALDLTAPGNLDLKVIELFALLKEQEDSFRKGVTKSGEGEGA